ncbi:MAG: hypothetical protein FWE62_04815, partial [Firmicutes bacterium]|nr:hypothetical protein [Bacillota bacterium]
MKRQFKMISVIIALILCVGVFGGCKPPVETPKDPTKTQLTMYNYDGGIGTAWLDKAKEIFEEKYKDEPFEPGVMVGGVEKKGVQISIARGKAIPTISASSNNMFFLPQVKYNDLISQKEVLEITDIVTENLSTVTGGKDTRTIAGKMSEAQRQA